MGKPIIRAFTAVLMSSALTAPALGQDPAMPGEQDEEVVVTAQRRSESAQDVPISIAVLNAKTVEAPGVSNITGLNGLIPNVVLETQGLVANVPMLAIRGMSSSDPDPNADPKVSTIIDGVYIPFVSGTMLDLFDIERVEVLKGPQGVLFGKNNLAGTFNIITARPTDDFEADARVTIGSNELYQFRGRINTGRFANDTMAAKLAVNWRDYGGYSRNIITGSKLNTDEVRAVRGAIDFQPSESFSSQLVVDWLKEKTRGPAPHVLNNGSAAYLQIPLIARTDIRTAAVVFDPIANTETYGASWTFNLKAGDGEVTAVLGY